MVLAKHNEEEAIDLKARMKRRRFPVFLDQTLELKRRERHSLLDVPLVVNSNSSNGNACLDEFLGSTVFDSEHAIDKRCPLRLIARVLQSILFGNLTIGLTVMALDKSSYVTFEIDRLAIVLNNALPDSRSTEDISMEHIVHIRALEGKGATLCAMALNLTRIGIEVFIILVRPHCGLSCALRASTQISRHAF